MTDKTTPMRGWISLGVWVNVSREAGECRSVGTWPSDLNGAVWNGTAETARFETARLKRLGLKRLSATPLAGAPPAQGRRAAHERGTRHGQSTGWSRLPLSRSRAFAAGHRPR